MKNNIFLGLGSNWGDKRANLNAAIFLLNQDPRISLEKISSWYETKAQTLPEDFKQQPNYLNGAAQFSTTLTPFELLDLCKNIEAELGRKPSFKRWQPRPIDLDILFYNDLIFESKGLVIPHSELCKRLFVLQPLNEIAPDFVHPVLKKKVSELYQDSSTLQPCL